MAKFIPPGFNADAARTGILNAMSFGEPTRTEDKAWFYFPKVRTTDPSVPVDDNGVPFDPDASLTTAEAKPRVQVSCVVDLSDVAESVETFGGDRPSKIEITLLDTEYQRVKGFAYVVAGGDKYIYDSTDPPVALGTIDVWVVHCTAEDES